MTTFAALLATTLTGLVVILQIALAAGAPLGALAWRGEHRVLPGRLRVGSLVAAGVLVVSAWVVLARAGLVPPGPEPAWVRVAVWVFAGFSVLNTLGNLASRSPWERWIMAPATIVLAICFVVVGLSG